MAFWFLPVFYRWFLAPLFVLLSVFLPHKASRTAQPFSYLSHYERYNYKHTNTNIVRNFSSSPLMLLSKCYPGLAAWTELCQPFGPHNKNLQHIKLPFTLFHRHPVALCPCLLAWFIHGLQ